MYDFVCVKTSWQNCILVQVKHTETHHWPHQRTHGATPVSGTSGSFYCWQTLEEHRYVPAQSVSPQLCVQARGCRTHCCQLSCQLKWQRSLHLNSRLPPGRCPWNHAQQNFWLGQGRGWIPVFWPQKMTSSCVLRVPGLQSLGSLAAAPWETLIEPLITRSRSVFPPQDSCVFQDSGWLVLF